jgi:hypothetical protein
MLTLVPACRSGAELRGRAEYNKAPFMYEMKGALSDPPHQIGQLPGFSGATRRPTVPSTHLNHRFPGYSRVPGFPGWCPFPAVKAFLLPLRESRKSLREFIFWFFSVHTLSTECRRLSAHRNCYPPAFTQFIHRLPSVTRRIPDMVAVCNQTGVSAGSREPGAVSPERAPQCRPGGFVASAGAAVVL